MTIRQWQRLARKAIVGGSSMAALLLSGAGTLHAQAPFSGPTSTQPMATQEAAPVRRNYMNRNVIDLPITMEEAKRALIQEIHLYVKDHSASPWVLREKGVAGQRVFRFQAPRDGEYWFTMVTVDKQGRSFPKDLQNEIPGLIVVIDTQKPVVELTNLGEAPEGQLIQGDIRDPHLDNARVRFYFQSGDKVFRPLEPMPGRPGIFCIPRQAVTTGVVRLVAEDLAGNQAVCEEHLNHMPVRGAVATNPQQVGVNPPISANPPRMPAELPRPNALPSEIAKAQEMESNDARMPQRMPTPLEETNQKAPYRPDGSEGPRFNDDPPGVPRRMDVAPKSETVQVNSMTFPTERPQPAPQPAQVALPAKRQIVNNSKVFLDYQIENVGPTGINQVEVWLTRDQGQTWRKFSEDVRGKSPVEVQLPGEGLYGVTLLVTNGRAAVPPVGADGADMWIEVDTTRPTAQITNVQVTHEKGQASVQLRWNAQDRNLGEGPVELYFAASSHGPWLPIMKGLNAEGQHRWMPPAEIGAQAHVRLMARDAAGNIAICHTLEPIHLEDPTRPRIMIRNVRTEAPVMAPPATTPTPRTPGPTGPAPFQIIQTSPTR